MSRGVESPEPRHTDPRETVLGVENLTVRYGRAEALRGVSLAVSAGEVFALLGRNGAGKSSLVRCLLGHRKPTAGRATLFGRDSWRHRASVLARVGVVPEEPDAPPSMTACQLERFCSRLYPRWDGAGFAERLDRFRVPSGVPFGRLSKGQKGQVMLALALAPRPELLVLDDPTLGLDVVARRAVFEEVVAELADRGITVFLTSHDLPGLEGVALRVGVLRDGALLVDEELESLKARFRRLVWTAEAKEEAAPGTPEPLAAMAPLDVRRRGRGRTAVVSRFDEDARARLASHPAVRGVEVEPTSLEEIFVALTAHPEPGEERSDADGGRNR